MMLFLTTTFLVTVSVAAAVASLEQLDEGNDSPLFRGGSPSSSSSSLISHTPPITIRRIQDDAGTTTNSTNTTNITNVTSTNTTTTTIDDDGLAPILTTLQQNTSVYSNSDGNATVMKKNHSISTLTFANLIVMADLEDFVNDSPGLTVFAPSDKAFAEFDPITLQYLMTPQGLSSLQFLLRYHMTETILLSDSLLSSSSSHVSETSSSSSLEALINETSNNSTTSSPTTTTTLVVPSAVPGGHDDLYITQQQQQQQPASMTSNSSSSSSSSSAGEDSGGGAMIVNGIATVISPDNMASNGVIHIIDSIALVMEQTSHHVEQQQQERSHTTPGQAATGMSKVVVVSSSTSQQQQQQQQPSPLPSLMEIIRDTPELSGFKDAVLSTTTFVHDLSMQTATPTTLFVPNNDAWSTFPILHDTYLQDASAWRLHLRYLVQNFISAGTYTSHDLRNGQVVTMLNGQHVSVVLGGGASTSSSGGGGLGRPASSTSTSPPTLSLRPAPLGAGGLATALHVDVQASNGVAHVLSSALLPDFSTRTLQDVVIASTAASTSTFAQLVVTANLEHLLRDVTTTTDTKIGWTVFAPSNEAFSKVDPAMLAYWQSPEGLFSLQFLIRYHVADSVIPLDDSNDMKSSGTRVVRSVQGGNLFLSTTTRPSSSSGTNMLQVNGVATIISSNHLAKNGILHVIDSVALTLPSVPPQNAGNAVESPSSSSSTTNENDTIATLESRPEAHWGMNHGFLYSSSDACCSISLRRILFAAVSTVVVATGIIAI